jgi:hypothetical protein
MLAREMALECNHQTSRENLIRMIALSAAGGTDEERRGVADALVQADIMDDEDATLDGIADPIAEWVLQDMDVDNRDVFKDIGKRIQKKNNSRATSSRHGLAPWAGQREGRERQGAQGKCSWKFW